MKKRTIIRTVFALDIGLALSLIVLVVVKMSFAYLSILLDIYLSGLFISAILCNIVCFLIFSIDNAREGKIEKQEMKIYQ